MKNDIKTMQLYPRADRILRDLRALGYEDDAPVSVDLLNRFDQLHYHGTEALDVAITTLGIKAGDRVLEVGSGWGGCARYIAQSTGAHVTAVELQTDYNAVATRLTERAQLNGLLTHINADFLDMEIAKGGFDHVVSWLALFHIPERARYLAKLHDALKPGGMVFAEDLYQRALPVPEHEEDFRRHLFPNSLVPLPEYQQSFEDAGFTQLSITDMTADWTEFTTARLADFHAAQAAYESVHGAEGYVTIETFYRKMAGYFADGLVGGLRVAARAP